MLVSFFACVSLGYADPVPQNELTSPKLFRRIKVDRPEAESCSRNERRTIARTIREATAWARLANDTAWDVTVGRPSNEQYEEWRVVRREILADFFGSARPRLREEIGDIFGSLLWELERSPGGVRQNDDASGNVV